MVVAVPRLLPCLLLFALALAGCSDDGGEPQASDFFTGSDNPTVQATSSTGGIRGVVVDDTIKPIKGALVEVLNTDKTFTTADDGLFAISGLEAGTYIVKATHPLFAPQQQNAEVVAGDDDPKAVKIQLIRTVFADPFYQTLTYDGYIVCSANVLVPGLGGLLSEECGEGAGVPCEVPVAGCQRVGGQENNNVQFDFTIGDGVKTMIVEKYWQPTSDAGKALYSPISTEWSCLPVCSGNTFAEIDGESPLMVAIDNATLEKVGVLPDETVISVFTWASPSYTGAVLSQRYNDYVTLFYHVPAPEGWSFVAGSPDPFA